MKKQIEQLYKPLYLYIRKRINNSLDAEDLIQEVFLKLSKSNIEKVDNVKNWVYSIAKNSIIDYYRKKKIITEDIENVVFPETESNDAIIDLSNCIRPSINQLPEDYREIISLSEIEGFSQKEIAKKLNINYTTVRSKVQRGRKKLKVLFTECCTINQGGKGSILDFERNEGCDNGC